jgi:hypothetical protein
VNSPQNSIAIPAKATTSQFPANRGTGQKTNRQTFARNNRPQARCSINENSDGVPRRRATKSTQSQLYDSLQVRSETLEVLKSIDSINETIYSGKIIPLHKSVIKRIYCYQIEKWVFKKFLTWYLSTVFLAK